MSASAARQAEMAAGSEQLEALIRSAPDLAPLANMQLRAIRAAVDEGWSRGLPQAVSAGEGVPLLQAGTIGVDPAQLKTLLVAVALEIVGDTDVPAMIRSGSVDSMALIHASICYDEAQIERLSGEVSLEPQTLGVIAQVGALPLLLAFGKRFSVNLSAMDWSSGYCPLCGAWPMLAEMRGLEREHWLRCGRCASGWRYDGASCVFCGENNHEQLGYLAAESERESRRAVTCDRCHGYLKSFATLGTLSAAGILARDLSSVVLDLAALEAGYARPSVTGYSLSVQLEPIRASRRWGGWRP